ncbi:MAG: hypothetical protein ABIR08_07290 [Sphingomonas sp.]
MTFEDIPLGQEYWFARNRAVELLKSTRCGCYNCSATFSPNEISEWLTPRADSPLVDEDGFSAEPISDESGGHCPHCATDFIIGNAMGWPVDDPAFLERVRFSVGTSWDLS